MNQPVLLPVPFTVVLMRNADVFETVPGWDKEFDTDIYVAHVRAHNKTSAVRLAQEQALEADTKDLVAEFGLRYVRALELERNDYTFLVLFEGTQDPKLFGFESGPWS